MLVVNPYYCYLASPEPCFTFIDSKDTTSKTRWEKQIMHSEHLHTGNLGMLWLDVPQTSYIQLIESNTGNLIAQMSIDNDTLVNGGAIILDSKLNSIIENFFSVKVNPKLQALNAKLRWSILDSILYIETSQGSMPLTLCLINTLQLSLEDYEKYTLDNSYPVTPQLLDITSEVPNVIYYILDIVTCRKQEDNEWKYNYLYCKTLNELKTLLTGMESFVVGMPFPRIQFNVLLKMFIREKVIELDLDYTPHLDRQLYNLLKEYKRGNKTSKDITELYMRTYMKEIRQELLKTHNLNILDYKDGKSKPKVSFTNWLTLEIVVVELLFSEDGKKAKINIIDSYPITDLCTDLLSTHYQNMNPIIL